MPLSFLPSDPDLLISTVNMFLRDGEYDDLEDLCHAFDRDPAEIIEQLKAHGYAYNSQQRQVRPIECAE